MFLWLVAGGWWGWSTPAASRGPVIGWSLVIFLLLLILGLHDFGGPIKG